MSETLKSGTRNSEIRKSLRLLLVEDSENDAMLLLREIRRGGYDPVYERVDTPEDMEAALGEADSRGEPYEIVISDYYMPRFKAPEALALLKRLDYDLPFIVVSGKVGEELAVEMMQAGAQDYITKENMVRLNPAIERELREAETRRERKLAEVALRESEERFRALTTNASDLVLILEADGTIRYESQAVERILGYKPEERVGKKAFELIHPDDTEHVTRAFAEYLKTPGIKPPVEYRTLARDGTWHYFEAVGNNLLHDPTIKGIVVNSRDITERKRSEAELERQAALIDFSYDAVMVLGSDGVITYWNRGAEELYGWSKEEAVGENATGLLQTEFAFSRKDVEAALRLAGRWEGELTHTRRDGRRVRIESRMAVVEVNGSRSVMEINRDITERKRNETELARLASFPRLNPNPTIETTVAGEVTYLNPAAEAWFPDLADSEGRHPLLADLVPVAAEIERSEGRPFNREIQVGDNFYLQTISQLPEGRLLRTYVTDTTERRRAEDGLRLLAEASDALSSSPDYHATLAVVAELAVPRIADWCAVDIVEDDGSLERLAVAHEDPEKRAYIHALRGRYPLDPGSAYGLPRVLCTGQPALVPEITEALLEEAVRDTEYREALRELGLGSLITVPLVARGRTLGAITLVAAESGRRYGDADLKLAEDLARRAAVAVDNARLYEAAQKELAEREQAEIALRESQERYQTFIAQSTEGILRFELEEPVPVDLPEDEQVGRFYRHGYLAECNDTLARMYGFSRAEEIIGARAGDMLPRSNRENVEFLKAGVRSGYKLVEAESQELDRRGHTKYFLNNLTGIVEDGKLVRAWGTQRDVTQQRRIQEALLRSEELYRTVVEQAAENIFLVDVETKRVLECNEAFRDSLGYEEREVEGMTLYDFIVSDPESIDFYVRQILDKGDYAIGERQYRRKDGSLVDVDVNASVVELEGREAMCVIAHDITGRKRVEETLEEVREAERNRMARDLHDDILQNMVYALQEAQILQVLSEDGGSEGLENIAEALRQSVEGLRGAIFELRLNETLRQTFMVSLYSLANLNRRMARHRYELEISVEEDFPEELPETIGREIIRVIQEALNNARRHADPEHVSIELGCGDDVLWTQVTDDGRGFDLEKSIGGVGQHLMRQRAEEIGGKLSVESSPGKGSTVRLEIPLQLIHE